MSDQLKSKIKLALRRWMLRRLRLWFDAVDDRLHTAEVRLREDLESKKVLAGVSEDPNQHAGSQIHNDRTPAGSTHARGDAAGIPVPRETFTQWEARRSGLTPKVKPQRRRRGVSSAEFNHRLATEMEAIFAEKP
jgi:hypothetical protein